MVIMIFAMAEMMALMPRPIADTIEPCSYMSALEISELQNMLELTIFISDQR